MLAVRVQCAVIGDDSLATNCAFIDADEARIAETRSRCAVTPRNRSATIQVYLTVLVIDFTQYTRVVRVTAIETRITHTRAVDTRAVVDGSKTVFFFRARPVSQLTQNTQISSFGKVDNHTLTHTVDTHTVVNSNGTSCVTVTCIKDSIKFTTAAIRRHLEAGFTLTRGVYTRAV